MPPATAAWLAGLDERDLVRFLACGSVDDGKSTLIGRLLHDVGAVAEDVIAEARRSGSSTAAGEGALDYARLVDGLAAEREQGITIDVAYRSFQTAKRRFVIADTPGHEQYTRNMATGASHSDLAVILVDAEKGVLPQTRRHAFLVSLLGIRHVIVAVNKMDRVGWREEPFQAIRRELSAFASRLQVTDLHFLPLSAKHGDNVVRPSERMPWHGGGTLLHLLETVHVASDRNLIDLRVPVQLVLRPPEGGRLYAGSVASGILRPGEAVVALPSGRRSTVAAITAAGRDVEAAGPPSAVAVRLTDEIDVSRGDVLAAAGNLPRLTHDVEAMVVWMGERPLRPGARYLVKHTTRETPARVTALRYRIDVTTLHRQPADELPLNEIGRAHLLTELPLAVDPYDRNRVMGSFLVIDPEDNGTVGAGLVLDREAAEPARPPSPGATDAPAPTAGGFCLWLTGAGAHREAREVADHLRKAGRTPVILADDRLATGLREEGDDDDAAGRRLAAVAAVLVAEGWPVVIAWPVAAPDPGALPLPPGALLVAECGPGEADQGRTGTIVEELRARGWLG